MASERETVALQGDNLPPGEVPFEYPSPDTTSEPSEFPTDRQASIVRQTCIKAAAMALQHGMGTPEEKAGGITYLAGQLENWVNRA
jgi:hypothetical protein